MNICRVYPLALSLLLLDASGAAAQRAVPGQAGWTGWMTMPQAECIERARHAISTQAGLSVAHVDSWYVHGDGNGYFVGIRCVADDNSGNLVSGNTNRMLVGVDVVARNPAGATGALRDALAAAMQRGAVTDDAILGVWRRTSDGSSVTMSRQGNQIVGRIGDLGNGGLAALGFRVGEETFRLTPQGGGRYSGQVKWRGPGWEDWRDVTQVVTGDRMEGTGSWVRERGGAPVVGGGAEPLLGSWRGCDGRTVQYTREGAEIVGRYTSVGGLWVVFSVGDIGSRHRPLGNGRYEGFDLWRWTDGRSEWRPSSITVTGNQFTDTGADDCSRQMTRVAAAGGSDRE